MTASKAKVVEAIEAKAKILLLDLTMPNEKRLAECTGFECVKFGGWLGAVGKAAGKQLVGKALTEKEVRAFWEKRAMTKAKAKKTEGRRRAIRGRPGQARRQVSGRRVPAAGQEARRRQGGARPGRPKEGGGERRAGGLPWPVAGHPDERPRSPSWSMIERIAADSGRKPRRA